MAELAEARLCLPPLPLANPRRLRLPKGSCDCHLHVFAAGAPLAEPRSYTPRLRGVDGWLELAAEFGIARGILVQPSVYGLDNRVLLDALAARPDRLRGVVVIDPASDDATLDRLHGLGVRGVRINLRNKAGIGIDAAEALAPRLRERGWHLQFQIGPADIDRAADIGRRHRIDAVIDHLAFMEPEPRGKPFADLQRALDGGVHVKISAPYRLADDRDFTGYRAMLGALAASHPERLLFGTDWPHTELFDAMPAEDDLIALVLDALPAAVQGRVFVDNPARLYWTR